VSFQSSIEVWFLEDDPALLTYDEFTERFAADEMIVLALEVDAFSEKTFAIIERIVEQVARAPHVHRVRSLLDFDLDPAVDFELEDLQEAAPDWQLRRETAAQNSVITPSFASRDGKNTAILVEVARSGNTVDGKRALVTALDALIEQESTRSGIPMYITGTPVLDQRALAYNDRDLTTIYPLIVPFILAFCWLLFGALWLALIPLLVVAAAGIWALGFMGLLGLQTTLLSSAMVPLFLAIGTANAIHMLAEHDRQLRAGCSGAEAASSVAVRLWKPCLFTSLTTAAGLSALLASSLRPVREFGLVAAVGVLAAFVLTMTLVPALLRLSGNGRLAHRHRLSSRVGSRLRQWVAFFARPPGAVTRGAIPVALLVGMLGIVSATRLEVGVDPMSWFRQADPFRLATEQVDAALGGATAIEFLVNAPDAGFRDPDVLRALDDFERWMEQATLATVCISGLDLLKEATRVASGGEYRVARLPALATMTRSILDALATRGELERWITPDFSIGRISCRLPLSSSANLGSQLDLLDEEIDRRFAGSPIKIRATGYGALIVQMEQHLVESQIRTISIAFVVVLLMLALLIRSARIAGIVMLPNLLPVIVGIGLMPLMGISLNPGTVMVAAVALGIVVDDTAHLLVAMRRQMDVGAGEALASAIEEVGAPVIITTLVVAGSMGMLTLGSFAPSIHFGVIAATIVIVALFADLLLLPRLLALANTKSWSGGAANGSL
jgi:predicted RND superfamily exporter protein